jgi:hypothetical protein
MQQILEELTQKYGYGPLILKEGGWCLLDTTPLPPSNELLKVISDIHSIRPVHIEEGKLRHSAACTDSEHSLPNKHRKALLKAAETLTEQKFSLAVHPDHPAYPGTPVVIALDPPINFTVYPDHPHINAMGGPTNFGYFARPDSLCYGVVEDLPTDPYQRMDYLLAQVLIWLVRHQVWQETRKYKKPGLWIGDGYPPIPPAGYPRFLNPTGPCRCGRDKQYRKCHMASDIVLRERCSIEQAHLRIPKYTAAWPKSVQVPQEAELDRLKQLLL